MNREARLESARKWLESFEGKNVVRGYRRWFKVDFRCAIEELELLGVELDQEYVKQIKRTVRQGKKRKAAVQPAEDLPDGYGTLWNEDLAFIAGHTSGGAAYGVTWEEHEVLERLRSEEEGSGDLPADMGHDCEEEEAKMDEGTINWNKVEEVALALLGLTLHDECRAWKALSWNITDRLHERGWIFDPKGKAKSVVLTDEGVQKAEELFRKHFVDDNEEIPF